MKALALNHFWRGVAMAAALCATASAAAPQKARVHADPWWKKAVIYQIYPRSFADSNGDGVGDVPGIISHLDYLRWLGVDAIWLAPTYPSPQVDFGYDISDYRAVDPQYGTMADLDRLRSEASRRGMRIMLDMVLNHTSDQHAWFQESRTSRTNAKADWYIWNDGVAADAPGVGAFQRQYRHEGKVPPNNWTSSFGGSAWEWSPARKQFYYHRYYKEQPDLNWRNPAVEKAMFAMMRFWLDHGVAGFRLDAITSLFEDAQLRDEPEAGGLDPFGSPRLRHIYTDDLPEQHAVIRRLRHMVDRYPGDRLLIGETWLADTQAMRRWYGGTAMDGLHLPMDMLLGFGGPRYSPDWFRPRLRAAQQDLGGAMPLFVFDNHDTQRSIDKFSDGVHDHAIAKGIATILMASRATSIVYYGAEIGMRTTTPERVEDVRDPIGIVGWPKDKGRDGERTPMQWTAGPQAGFSSTPSTWLPIPPNYKQINVADEQADPASLLNWYRALIALRRSEPAFRTGKMDVLDAGGGTVMAWTRKASSGGGTLIVAINMTAERQTFRLSTGQSATRLISTNREGADRSTEGKIALLPFESWIGRLR